MRPNHRHHYLNGLANRLRPKRTVPKPLAPSKLAAAAQAEPPAASPDARFARGRIIHRLLQSLPDLEDGAREDAAARYLANPQHRLAKTAQEEIKAETLRLLRHPDYAPLFAPGSRAEVSLAGYVGGQPVSGQIDRLCVREDGVWIIDYKTNRPPPVKVEDVPPLPISSSSPPIARSCARFIPASPFYVFFYGLTSQGSWRCRMIPERIECWQDA